jgi:hypothetical protein
MHDQQKRQTELHTDFFTLEWSQKVCTEGGKINTKQKGIFDRKKATLSLHGQEKSWRVLQSIYYYKLFVGVA